MFVPNFFSNLFEKYGGGIPPTFQAHREQDNSYI